MMEVIKTFLLAMTPIGELRLALPVALTVYSLPPILAYVISILGNLAPIVFLLLFLGPVSRWFSNNFNVCQKFFNWLFARTRKNSSSRMEKYGNLALISFVAIPLPFTGAWTGAIVAFLFGISFRKAFPLIAFGVIIAGVIILILTQMGLWLM